MFFVQNPAQQGKTATNARLFAAFLVLTANSTRRKTIFPTQENKPPKEHPYSPDLLFVA